MNVSRSEALDLCALLARLYREQLESTGPDAYLADHATPEFIKHHVNVFLWYSKYLTDAKTILDWGCHHGPDSCLIRHRFGDRNDLHGCDFPPESEFRAFRDYSRIGYRRLTDALGLPYPEDTFDVAIGSGVLEHTAMDLEALKALYRVLKPDGTLVITYLPNRWSRDEWYRRRVRKTDFHRRLYGMSETETLLKRCGFYPLEISFQTFVPNVVDGRTSTWVKRLLRPILHPIYSHDVLCCVARKMTVM